MRSSQRALFLTVSLAVAALAWPTQAMPETKLPELPIQHEGRVKPLDTFARLHLLAFSGKRSLGKITPAEWLLDVLTTPDGSSPHRVFNIRNPEVVTALGLPLRAKRRYTFDELAHAVGGKEQMIRELQSREQSTLSPVESQLVEIYRNLVRHQELSLSASCLLPLIELKDSSLARELGLEAGRRVSLRTLLEKSAKIAALLEEAGAKDKNDWSPGEKELFAMTERMNQLQRDRFATALTVLPPADELDGTWASPWSVVGLPLSPAQKSLLDGWEELLAAHLAKNATREIAAAATLEAALAKGVAGPIAGRLELESWFNRSDLFYMSVAFYILAALSLALSWVIKPNGLRKAALASLLTGIAFHIAGLAIRMIIMGRAPVSNLYESIVFVSVTAAISGLVLELMRRDGMGILLGSIAGAVLHFVAFSRATDGDTMGMLVAVLNSNFWLSTHVVTITIGYGTSLVAGLGGHIFLIYQAFRPREGAQLETLYRNMIGLTLVALFFTLFGTILGGIWADQSWGRFWGWDPKENGALLIVLWQLMLLHGRHNGLFKPRGFAFGLVLSNIVVAVAWFGVNLLNVGLHSYGFTSGAAMTLALFCGAELLFGTLFYLLALRHGDDSAKSAKNAA